MSTNEERLLISLEARFAKYEKEMAKAARTTDQGFTKMERRAKEAGNRMEQSLAVAASRVGGQMKSFGIGLAAGAAAGVASLLSLQPVLKGTKDALADLDKVAKAAKASGLDAETYQEFAHAAELGGVAADDFAKALQTLNKNAGLAAVGKGKLVSTLKALNPELLKSITSAKSQAERVRIAADAIDRAEGASRKAALATALFGDQGVRLVEVFKGGSASLDAMAAEARKLGIVFDRELVAQAERLGDELAVAQKVIDAQFTQALVDLAPVLVSTAKLIAGMARELRLFLDLWRDYEQQSNRSLDRRLAELGHRRLEIEKEIGELKAAPAPSFLEGSVDNSTIIAALEEEMRKLAEAEARILKILNERSEESKAATEEAAPAVEDLNTELEDTESSAARGARGIKTYADAIRALKGEIPELTDALSELDARTRIDQAYKAALAKATSIGDTIEATRLRDQALKALSTKGAREAGGKGILDLIGYAEGTDKGRGYNETLGYGAFTGGPKNLVNMTLDEIDAMQGQMLEHPKNTFNSSAAGRYQIVRKTLRGLRAELGLSGNEMFDADMQDRLAQQLVRRRGNDPAALRNEWEGLRRVDDGTIRQAFDTTSLALPAADRGVVEKRQKLEELKNTYKEITDRGQQHVAGQQMEQQALGLTSFAAAKLRYEHQLLNEAQSQGIELTARQRQEISTLAEGMALADQALAGAVDRQQQLAEGQQWIGQQLTGLLSGILTGSMSAEQAVQRLVQTLLDAALQAMLLGEGPLASLFGMTGGGLFGSLFGMSTGGVVEAATGGMIRGPGTGTSDSIPAMLSDGEFVINAKATRKHAALLAAINEDKIPAFANGGLVNGGKAPLASMGGSTAPVVNITTNVQAAQGGDARANEDAAKRTAAAVENTVRGIVASELRRQTRPGNLLNRNR
ncbi:MAG TPA: hypothetical protein VGN97_01035 [Mesorhizobium sp.]|jgi:muramidase (phage lysozyme)/chorismate mutase|nr:hypothetical protein [Mesorhizobium sp.]